MGNRFFMAKVLSSRPSFILKNKKTYNFSNSYNDNPVIVFSHLRWEFVTQRPQHIMKRLAKNRKIFFVEEPISFDSHNHGTLHISSPEKNITVIQPRISFEEVPDILSVLLQETFASSLFSDVILWFYTPAFVDVAYGIDSNMIVYDCMDELSAFKGASPSLLLQEKKLFRLADVVFTGGRSLYEEKCKYHNNVYCFPSSVDVEHFGNTVKKSTLVPHDLLSISQPIIGFHGVIDERLDLELIAATAKEVPFVSFVFIGPIVKISADELPQLPNVHYLGIKPYESLPSYLKGMKITIMPFALNKSTQFISPTKTLEYMAALKPIISTPIKDVEKTYPNEVAIVRTPHEFTQAIMNYLYESPIEEKKRIELQQKVIGRTSWDNTVTRMESILFNEVRKTSILQVREAQNNRVNLGASVMNIAYEEV
jgi:glycosyltransferase involved in cell wall biosynthesis